MHSDGARHEPRFVRPSRPKKGRKTLHECDLEGTTDSEEACSSESVWLYGHKASPASRSPASLLARLVQNPPQIVQQLLQPRQQEVAGCGSTTNNTSLRKERQTFHRRRERGGSGGSIDMEFDAAHADDGWKVGCEFLVGRGSPDLIDHTPSVSTTCGTMRGLQSSRAMAESEDNLFLFEMDG